MFGMCLTDTMYYPGFNPAVERHRSSETRATYIIMVMTCTKKTYLMDTLAWKWDLANADRESRDDMTKLYICCKLDSVTLNRF